MTDKTAEQLLHELSLPFEKGEVKYKPGAVRGNRCIALAYVDARVVMDRLDEVFPLRWRDEYKVLEDGVLCILSLKFGEEWITRCDVGCFSEQPDDGDKLKAAVSDALKRAAVKFGVSRYLYRLPIQWVDFDPQKKMIVKAPEPPEPPAHKPSPAAVREAAYLKLENAAKGGMAMLAAVWNAITPEERQLCKHDKEDVLKPKAMAVDAEKVRDTPPVMAGGSGNG